MSILTSVIICTHNRCDSLKLTLGSLEHLEGDPARYEIVIVDNNSADATRELISEYSKRLAAGLRYVFEPELGLSHARNAAVREAGGEICLFIDDDVIVDKKWLGAMLSSFEDVGAACVFGRIFPAWQGRKPEWLTQELYGKLALLDWGDEPFRLGSRGREDCGYGANWGVRKRLFERVGFFQTDLGVKGKKLFCGEEQEFVRRLLRQGEKAFYQPAAVVHHRIEKDRLRKSYFRKSNFYSGMSHSLMEDEENVVRLPGGIPRYAAGRLRRHILDLVKAGMRGQRQETFRQELGIIFWIGFIWGKFERRSHPS